MNVVRVLALAGCVLASAAAGWAQQTVDYASVSGRVSDPSGAIVSGATVTARQTETNVTATTVTDDRGRFRFAYLKVGPYEIIVARPGFTNAVRKLALGAGAAFELPLVLTLATAEVTVDVIDRPQTLETARSQIAGTVSETEVQNLPLNGRNFLEVALLVPGVSATNVASTQLFPETSAVPGVTLSVGSQRNLSNNFIVDGLSANDDAAALSGITYGVDAIEQLQVVTSGGQAELGRALGGYVNIVTKSGTNFLHGTAYEYVRDDRWNARNPLLGSTLPMNQSQFGGSLGGPLLKNRTFYFGNAERRSLDQSGLTTIVPENVAPVNARLSAAGYQGPPLVTGVYPSPVTSTNVLAKVDHAMGGGRNRLTVRYGLYDTHSTNARGAGGLSAPSASAGLDNIDQTIALGAALTLTAQTLVETRAQFADADLTALPTDPIGPAVSIAGVASFGTLSTSPTGRVNRLYQVVNNVFHQRGTHAIKAGVDFLYNDDRITFPRSVRGAYSFSSLANFLSGIYGNAGFTQTFGATRVAQRNPNVGFYGQDEWKVTPAVTLNLGLRYDLQWLETIHADTNNVSPRVGLAWAPFAARKTIVRASAGLFYDRVPLRALANALLSAGNTTDLANLRQIAVSLSPAQAAAPVFPNILTNVAASATLPSLTTMDRDLQNAFSRQASVEIEHQIGNDMTVSTGYQYLRGLNLLMSVNQNVPSCVASGTNNGCRPNPAFGNNSQYSSAGSSNYHAWYVTFLQRPARWGSYRVSYTLSTSMNNLGEFFFSQPIDPFDLSKDWGRSDDDQRHRLVMNGTLQTHGFLMSGLLQASSAPPFNITSGATTIQGTTGRPLVNGTFIERNAGVGSAFVTLNARLSRAFRVTDRTHIEAIVEGFNLTNHRNVVTRNTNFGPGTYPTSPAPAFGQITGVGEPRSFQFGMRVRF